MKSLGLPAAGNVLFPSYHCGAELNPIVRSGAHVTYYRIDRSARIDLDHLHSVINNESKVLFVTHYFGFPTDMGEVMRLCAERQLVLIEDCAHALYSKHQGRCLGTLGDLGVFSMRKTLPLPDGGALLSNNHALRIGGAEVEAGQQSLEALRRTKALLDAHFLCRYGPFGRALKRYGSDPLGHLARRMAAAAHRPLSEPAPKDGVAFDPRTGDRGMSRISNFVLRRIDHLQAAERRRSNFQILSAELGDTKRLQMLYPVLPHGVCPWSFPIIVDDPSSLRAHLRRHGIEAGLFGNEFHSGFPAEAFPDAVFLRTRVVTLPIHQALDRAQLKRMVEAVWRWTS